MKQLIHFVTLGVEDLGAMKKFYTEKFGWTPLKDEKEIVFIKMNGFILSLFPNDELAKDAGVNPDKNNFKGFTFAVNFHSEDEVDKAFAGLRQKGVHVVKEPQKVFWGGYSGYVEDIEHNLWELAFNPFLVMDENGNVSTHK
jgi:uncharacterized protein